MKAHIKKTLAGLTAGVMLSSMSMWSAVAYNDEDITNSFTFTATGITAMTDEGGYKIDGTELTINASGTYVVSGTCLEGGYQDKERHNRCHPYPRQPDAHIIDYCADSRQQRGAGDDSFRG